MHGICALPASLPRDAQHTPATKDILKGALAERALQLLEEALVGLVCLVGRLALELLEQAPLLLGQPARDDDVDEHAVVAAPEALQHRHPATRKHANVAGLRARRKLELHRAVERVGRERRAERRFRDRQVDRREDVVALAHEARIWHHVDADVHVAGTAAELSRMPLAGDPDLLPVVDAGGDLHLEPALFDLPSGAPAFGARGLDDPAGAAAARAALRAHELAEDAVRHLLHAPRAAAGRARRRHGARLGAVTVAAPAPNRDPEGDV